MNYWKRQARRRMTPGYKKRKAASEKARKEGLKALKKAEYQRRAKLGNITKKANRLLKQVRAAMKEDYMPDAYVDFANKVTEELKKPRDYQGLEQSIQYLQESDAWEYYNSGAWKEESPVVREELSHNVSMFWRIMKRVQDLGYGSYQAIDAVDHYQEDTGGIPIYKKIDDIVMAVVKYDKTGEDEYKAASTEADDNGDDFENFDDLWIG